MIELTVKERTAVPLEAECLSPDVMASLSRDAICALPVLLGKHAYRVDEFFAVEGAASDELKIRGDAGNVKWIGRGMTRGRIAVQGNAGMHLGSQMRGGTIEVSGNASDWIGAEMSGGLIRVRGNAGGQVGAAYRGSAQGMRNGTIIIGGSAGLEVGMRMRRGVIVVEGPARDFAGLQMKGGTIFLLQGAELRTGAWMNRGTIVSLAPIPLLPTFSYDCQGNPVFMRLLAGHLEPFGISVPYREQDGGYECYSGDSAVPGKGEILIWQARS
jgi:formylmethanofuran dehydrogenase subunit C